MNTQIKIGKVVIGDHMPFAVIPEAGDNHHGSLSEAIEIAHAAKEAGALIIKFQLHLPDEEMDREGMRQTSSRMFQKWGDLYGFIKENQLSVENHSELIRYCEKIGIQYLCTPFSDKAAKILTQIGGDAAFKIGSGETEDLLMIEEVAALGKPMIVSTGMSTYEEIDLAVKEIEKHEVPFCLMHCISAYPPKKLDELHLGVIRELRDRYNVVVGFSDHTPPEGVVSADGKPISEETIMFGAAGMGARFVEKHFTIDRKSKDADSWFSHDPATLKNLIETAKLIDQTFDDKRDVFEEEKGVWVWAKRSVFASRDIPAGTTITRNMLKSKRPGTGIRSKDYYKILGRVVKHDVAQDQMLQLTNLE